MPQVVRRFHRIESARARSNFEGSGIGLALVKELVELNGGSYHAPTAPKARAPPLPSRLPFGDRASSRRPNVVATGGTPAASSVLAEAYLQEALRWTPADADPGTGEDRTGGPTPAAPVKPGVDSGDTPGR